MSRISKSIEKESRLVVLRAGVRRWKQGLTANRYRISLVNNENTPKSDCSYGCTTIWIYKKKTLNCTL